VPVLLGLLLLAAGFVSYGRELRAADARDPLRLVVLGPAFVAAALGAFAGEHFTAATSLAEIVPKWLPAPLFIVYLVGVAHLAAAVSFVARRYVRLAALLLAVMFGLFVLLMDLPGAIARPGLRIAWSLAARQTTFALGALALFTIETPVARQERFRSLVNIIRVWTAFVLVFYGVENVLYPQYWPGVPDVTPVAPWVPAPTLVAFVTGLLLIAGGVAMLIERYAVGGAAAAGWLMVLLALGLFLPQFVLARGVSEHVVGLNFCFDTLLFAGTMLVIGRAILEKSRAGDRTISRDVVQSGSAPEWHSGRRNSSSGSPKVGEMTTWHPFREPLRMTLARTITIAVVVGALVAPSAGGLRSWPVISLLALWPSFGGHWVELAFLKYLRPRLPATRPIQRGARLLCWFAGGMILGLGVRVTAMLLRIPHRIAWLTLAMAGFAFIVIELIAHTALHLRGRPSFYNGLG
jgi:uncharacterized membrane protein